MILIRLTGGLGNQMFQYAFGKALAWKHNVPFKLDTSLLGENAKVDKLVVRHFDLDVFDLKIDIATQQEIEDFNGKEDPGIIDRVKYRLGKMLGSHQLVIQREHEYNAGQIDRISKNACVVGRWQSELYFKSVEAEVRRGFSFGRFQPNTYSKGIANEMEGVLSVAVHVRRGDYITHPVYSKTIGALDKQYYLDAIFLLRSKFYGNSMKFFFVSDDIEWCKTNFSLVENAVFVEQERTRAGYFSDLWLMTCSRHCIISNSTFSWWGAWLGEKSDSIIIAPENWAKEAAYIPQNIIPDRWIKLKNSFEQ